MSIAELPNRPYKAIIGWPYLQEKRIAIDGDGPFARFPKTAQEAPILDRPRANLKPVSPAQLQHLVKRLGPGSLGVAFIFNEPETPPQDEVKIVAISQADLEANEAALRRPKADPRTLLPEEYHDYLDLCTPPARFHGPIESSKLSSSQIPMFTRMWETPHCDACQMLSYYERSRGSSTSTGLQGTYPQVQLL